MRGWPVRWVLLLACCACLGLAADPVDPRPASRVADPDHRLTAADRSAIDAVSAETRAAGRGELLVIVVGTSSGRVLRTWGTELFNRWRIGSRTRNDGLLIIAALDDHRCELVLGDGVDDPERVAASQQVFDEVMKPRFKAGDPGGALVTGAREAARRILTGFPELEAETPAVERPPGLAAPASVPAQAPPPALEIEAPPVERPSGSAAPAPAPTSSTFDVEIPWWAVAGGGAAGAGIGGWLLRRWIRLRPRNCRTCGSPQARLDERADDAHLDGGERCEESLGSVDYDVWSCPSCGRIDKGGWRNWFTGYCRCPRCASITRRETTTTLVRATEYSGGSERIDGSCRHCGHADSRTRSTPRISRSSSGSSSSGGGSSSGRGGGGSW